MTHRRRTWIVRIAAGLAVPVALVLALLAVDVLRVPANLERDDVRFNAAPKRQRDLWFDLSLFPGRPAERLLEVDDDVSYRRTASRFLRVQPGVVDIFGPQLENLRGKVQFEVTRGSAGDENAVRRAQYLNYLAVMSLERVSGDTTEAQNTLRRGIHTLRSAVETDPSNSDAKLNLELALRNAQAVNLPGTDPTGGAAEGSISGQGRAGSGY